MDIIYQDRDILVCIKPAGVKSTDEPGGLPELLRKELGDPEANLRTVHRLDQAVSGLMVLATRAKAASELSRQIREGDFHKEYLAVVHGTLPEKGTFCDLLLRNKQERKTYVVDRPGKDVQEAVLDYERLAEKDGISLVKIVLRTGRTHQIRCQFASHGLPLVGDKKYGRGEDCPTALWSAGLAFFHPYSGQKMEFSHEPPEREPWTRFLQEKSFRKSHTGACAMQTKML